MPNSTMLRSALLAFVCSVSVAANAIADSPKTVNVPAGDLTTALELLAKQSGVELVYRPEQLKGLRTQGVQGTLSSEEAVTKLLQGTQLTLQTDQSGVLLIGTSESGGAAASSSGFRSPSPTAGKSDSSDRLSLAQNNTTASDSGSTEKQFDQNSDQNSGQQKLEEIVVTAQKREERQIEVPISMVVLTPEDLAARSITSVEELVAVVPGLSIQNNGATQRIELRGISNVAGNNPLVGQYLDEADVTSGAFNQVGLNLYDLQRVEVLRGPQGTLYGEGSMGGTLRYITNDPVLNRFEFGADMAALFTQDGAPSQRIQTVLNVPLVDNKLGIRVAGLFDHEGGWINQPGANLTNINDSNLTDVRTKLLWRPTDSFAITAMADIHRATTVPSYGEDDHGSYTQTFNLTTTPWVSDDFDIYNLTLTYDFGFARLVSTTTYVYQDNEQYNDGELYQFTPQPSAPAELYQPYEQQIEKTFSDELRLVSIGDGPWQWTVGGFFRNYRKSSDAPVAYFTFPPIPPLGTPLDSYNLGAYLLSTKSKSTSGFADTSYKFFGRLTIGAGVRYFHDDQSYSTGMPQEGTFHSVDPRFYVDAEITENTHVYANAAKGFRSGGFNLFGRPPYQPEQVWTYELGVKSDFLERRLNFDFDVFYSNYKDYVVSGVAPPPNPPYNIYRNAGNAVIKGVELSARWRISEGWKLSVAGDYLDDYFTSVNILNPAPPGTPLSEVYKYQGDTSLEHDFRWSGKPAYARVDYSLLGPSGSPSFPGALPPIIIPGVGSWYGQSREINTVNFDAGITWSKNLHFGVSALNISNSRGFVSDFGYDSPRVRPRTYVLKFGVDFD